MKIPTAFMQLAGKLSPQFPRACFSGALQIDTARQGKLSARVDTIYCSEPGQTLLEPAWWTAHRTGPGAAFAPSSAWLKARPGCTMTGCYRPSVIARPQSN